MSSHREAPEISKDPVADNADVYAFVSPDDPTTVTIVTNFVPLQGPAGGPNFYEFGDDVLYSIYIDNDGDAKPEIEYQFQFTSTLQNPNTFLYNTGPIGSLDRPELERAAVLLRSRASTRARSTPQAARGRRRPGRRGTARRSRQGPTFPAARTARARTSRARRATSGRARRRTTRRTSARRRFRRCRPARRCSAGQRSDPFYVDLGSIFDLGALRPFSTAHLIPLADRDRRRRDEGAEHPHDRDPGPDRDAHQGRLRADDVLEPGRGARHLERGEPPQGADVRRPQERHGAVGPVGAGLAARQPALQRGDRPARREGRLEPRQSRGRRGVPAERPASRARRPAAGPLPGRVPEPRRPHAPATRADLVAILLTGIPPGVVLAGVPELHGPDATPTCCG